MYLLAAVTKWVSPRNSKGHVSGRESAYGGRYILLNPNRMSDIHRKGVGTAFYFTENLNDPKNGRSYIEIENNILDVYTALNTAYTTQYLAMDVYRDNDITKPYVQTYIPSSEVAYIDDVNGSTRHCWVSYSDGGKQRKTLCYDTMEGLYGTYLLRDFDGNVYRTATIGTQIWTVQNLRTTHYADGSAIPNITNDALWLADVTGAYCYYDNNPSYKEIYGALYNWYAVDNVAGLCYFSRGAVQDANWRIPTRADYDTLITTLGGTAAAGDVARERTRAHWLSYPYITATDTYGFMARGAGNRDYDDDGFINQKIFCDWWTSEALDADHGYSQYVGYMSSSFFDYSDEKYGGISVRCVKDV